MNIGSFFMIASLILFFLTGLGVKTIPGVDAFAHASFVLGVLLGGLPLGPFFWRGP